MYKASIKNLRISPRKVGVVAALIRRRTVVEALEILKHTERKSARDISKLLDSAIANVAVKTSSAVKAEDLVVNSIMVTEGRVLRRYKFVGSGRRSKARPMLKRSSHVYIELTTLPAETLPTETSAKKNTSEATKKSATSSEGKTVESSATRAKKNPKQVKSEKK